MLSAPYGIEPEPELSFPSNWTVKPYEIGVPSAATPSNVYLRPSPCASTVRVRLFGAGPGSYFDFSRFSFHVPTKGLLSAARKVEEPTTSKRVIATNSKTRFMCDPPWVGCLPGFVALIAAGKRNNWRNNMTHGVSSQ